MKSRRYNEYFTRYQNFLNEEAPLVEILSKAVVLHTLISSNVGCILAIYYDSCQSRDLSGSFSAVISHKTRPERF
jgi:hypothetical protein